MGDPDGLLGWLASDDLEAPGGHCLSWWNPARPGYAYPEISGLLLRLLSLAPTARARRQRLLAALLRDYAAAPAVHRGGQGYTFDTAMVLGGVLAHAQAPDPDPAAERAARGWTSLLIAAA